MATNLCPKPLLLIIPLTNQNPKSTSFCMDFNQRCYGLNTPNDRALLILHEGEWEIKYNVMLNNILIKCDENCGKPSHVLHPKSSYLTADFLSSQIMNRRRVLNMKVKKLGCGTCRSFQ